MKRVLCLVLMATMLFSMAFCHAETSVYPLEPVTLTVNMDETARESIPDWALDYYIWDIIEKQTGVKLECWGADGRAGGNTEDINVMIAGGNYPDIFINNWLSYPGGPSKAIESKIIIPLNGVVEQYCPNLTKALAHEEEYVAMQEWRKKAKSVASDVMAELFNR